MLVDDSSTPPITWKDMDLGKDGVENEDIVLTEDDVLISSLHGSPSIEYSERIL